MNSLASLPSSDQPPAQLPRTVRQRISVLPSGCWEWTGLKDVKGYGRFTYHGKYFKAHRLVYEVLLGPIVSETLDHLCRNRACVNPAHLEQVSRVENVRRGFSFSTLNSSKTHCPQGHELSGDNLDRAAFARTGWRRCRICKNRDNAAYKTRCKTA